MNIGKAFIIFAVIRLGISIINWIYYLLVKKQGNRFSGYTDYAKEVSKLSVLIPARNEEDNITKLLSDLLRFPNQPGEIIVYDDLSTDNTAYRVRKLSEEYPHIKLLQGEELPEGWLGKNHACYQLAKVAVGDKLLFLDADVHIKSGLFEKSITYMDIQKVKLLSIFPVQDMPTNGSMLSVPLMNWILLSLLPLPLVMLSKITAFSAANGQFMLFDRKVYNNLQPHRACKFNPVEDIAIIRKYKKEKIQVATISGPDEIHCTMYYTLKEAIDGFSKNIFQFFGGSMILTYLFAFATTFAPVFVFISNGYVWGMVYLFTIMGIRLFVSMTSRQSIISNILLLIPQQFIFWKIIITATWKRKRKNIIWKGRNIS